MYEGTTEYFAQLFQVYEGLIDETEFYNRIYTKLENKNRYDKTMSFTEMSANILESPYKDNYMNIYEKGALISMCIDILIRENTQGKKGIIDLMEALSKKYGNNTPFQDDELIGIIGDLTAPNVEFFLNKHVVGGTPIDYNKYLLKVGLQLKQSKIETGYFINKYDPYISPDKIHNRIYFNSNHEYNSFLTDLKIQPNDILVSINNRKFNLDNIRELFLTSRKWKKGEQIQMTINRGGVEFTTSTKIIAPPFITSTSIESINENELTSIQKRLRSRWLNL